MAILQNLEIAFSSKETNPTELTTKEVENLILAIATKRNNSDFSITHANNGTSQLSGYITPANNGSIAESNQYILTRNGVIVLGNVQTETYRLNSGGINKLYEGKELQLYCLNSASNNVSMQSMKVWITLDFKLCMKDASITDEFIRQQFNAENWINLGNERWRGTLTDRSGLIKIATSDQNVDWSIPLEVAAYPASIDDDPSTTDEYREQRLTEAISIDSEAVAVTGAQMVNNPATLEPGRTVLFTLTELLPRNNTKESLYPLSTATITFSAEIGNFVNGQYKVPDNTDYDNITYKMTYMNKVIQETSRIPILSTVLSKTKNAPAFNAFKEALGFDETKDSITNIDASGYTNAQVNSAIALFAKYNVDTFDELRYFTRVLTLEIPEDGLIITSIRSPYVTTLSGTGSLNKISSISIDDLPNVTTITNGNLFLGNTELTDVTFSKLTTIRCDYNNIFNGCINLSNVKLPMLSTITSAINHMFEGCELLSAIDLSGVVRFTSGTSNYMFKNCKSLVSVNIWELGNFVCDGDIAMFEGCESLSQLSLNSVQRISSTNGDITLFKNCISINSIDLSAVTQISCPVGTNALLEGCSFLTSYNLNNLTSIRCKNNRMFAGCSSIEIFNLPNISTWSVVNDEQICIGCTELIEATYQFSTINCSGKLEMFKDCSSLETIHLDNLTTIVCGDNNLFNNCSRLNNIELNLVSITSVNNNMFKNCGNLEHITLNALETISHTGKLEMFIGCNRLEYIALPNILSITSNDDKMFFELQRLFAISMPKLEVLNSGTGELCTFNGTGLTNIDLPKLKTIKGFSIKLFNNTNITTINLPKLEEINCNYNYLFSELPITSITLPSLKILNCNVEDRICYNCSSLIEFRIPVIEILNLGTAHSFEGCLMLEILDFGKYSDNTNPLKIGGNLVYLCDKKDIIQNIINASEFDNIITSRITELNAINFLYDMEFEKIAFPHLTTLPNSPALNFRAMRIKLC